MSKFGELAIRSSSLSLGDDTTESDFATIDLGSKANGQDLTINQASNDEQSYTSFVEPSSLNDTNNNITAHANSFNGNYHNKVAKTNYIPPANSTEALNGSYRSVSSSNSYINLNQNQPYTNRINGHTDSNGANMTSILSGNMSAQSVLTSATEASSKLASKTVSTIETLKLWSKSAYKCTKQLVSEKLGKSSRTVDPELEASIDNLRENKKKYENVLTLSRTFSFQLQTLINTQKQLADSFADLAQKSHELIDEFTVNSETQRQVVRHGEALLSTLNLFISSLTTLCNKTIEDTLTTVRNYEAARLEYDAYKVDLETFQQTLPTNAGVDQQKAATQISLLERDLVSYRERYDNLKKDVVVKIRFLDENRVKVMKKQLCLFQNAIAAYFTGNFKAVEAIMQQCNLNFNPSSPISANPDDGSYKFQSFLEKN